MKELKCSITQLIPRLGGLFCAEKELIGFFLKRKGSNINPETFGKTALDTLIKEDKLIGMLGFFSVENNDQESDYATSVTKERRKTIHGTKGFRFVFDKNACFQNQLNKLDGSDNYEFIPVFKGGSSLWAKNRDGSIKGFDCKLFVGIKQLQVSADVAGSTLEVDITPRGMASWQDSAVMYQNDEFGFDEITPVAGLDLEMPILAVGQTTTTIRITELCADAVVSGLTKAANWSIERNGVLESVTGTVTEVNGNYTFTHTAYAANDKIRFMTNVAGYPVYVFDNNYYAGESELVTVA